MKVYQSLEVKDVETGLFYKEWEVPEGMPIASNLILTAPSENLQFPRFNSATGFWEEDKDSIIEFLKAELEKIKADNEAKVEELKNGLMDAMEYMSTLGGAENV